MFVEYVWLIVIIPLLSFAVVGALGKRMEHGGGYVVILGAAMSFLLSVEISYDFFTSEYYTSVGYFQSSMHWFSIGDFDINMGIYLDQLTCVMMMFATLISTLIFIYSLGYMYEEGLKRRRYFAEVALFLTGMVGCVTAGNLLQMFLFWEIMGLCSYLLIGFWGYDHPEADQKASAAKKAFLVTRAGDVCLMAGLFVLFMEMGSLDYITVFNADNLQAANSDVLMLASLLIFGGAIGKSAQFPLLDWLPDAMAGPTTVSALIHAATMVKAGVYVVARCFPLFVMNKDVMIFVGTIGGVTAFFTATMAMNNFNIKKVLAYSTLSQLGYMFLSLGAGGYLFALGMEKESMELMAAGSLGFTAAILHMVNHAFFKACLFLGSGSVIHSMGTEDMREMGGLRKEMPITAYTMLIATLSIVGFPFFQGFWSKDLVLDTALDAFNHGAGIGAALFMIMWTLGLITAFMTAFYMFRLWYMTFSGDNSLEAMRLKKYQKVEQRLEKKKKIRKWKKSRWIGWTKEEKLGYLREVDEERLAVRVKRIIAETHAKIWAREGHHVEGLRSHGESPKSMTVPLIILAIFSFGSGFTLLCGFDSALCISLTQKGWTIGGSLGGGFNSHFFDELMTNYYTYVTIDFVIFAIVLAYVIYSLKAISPGRFNLNGKSVLYTILANRWYLPKIYDEISWKFGYGIAKVVDYFDRNVIDGTVNGLSNAVIETGDNLSVIQDGNVHSYASIVILGVVQMFALIAIICVFFGVIA